VGFEKATLTDWELCSIAVYSNCGKPEIIIGSSILRRVAVWEGRFTRRQQMKLITAVINPFKIDAVRESLSALGVLGMTVTEVKGCGRQKGITEIYRGAEYVVNFLPKLQIEVAVKSGMLEVVIAAIASKAKTGKVGDGKIFVTPLEQVVRIRTGETGDDAL
jgi:nitrogen regulatory protein P-II 2